MSTTNAGQNMPYEVVLNGTPSGMADGGIMLTWSLNLNGVSVGGGNLRMLPGDPCTKLLFAMRGSLMEALKTLRLQDLLVAGGAGTPFTIGFGADLLALLPNNPNSAGLSF